MDLSNYLKSVEGVMFESKAGYVFEYDYTNKKVKVLRHLRTLTTAAHDLASVTAGTTVDVDITVTGVTTSDRIVGILPPVALEHGIIIQSARVKSANTITIRISNVTAGDIDPAAGDFSFVLEQDVAQEVPNTTDLSALEDVRFLAWGY
ncbi:MAG: hypothetical protein VR72_02975 [Clostridiaceae bacterium BRH_c20a]|nr:MAG: hypothetical protein VR72_02975 [Clostridiaceae bacterium BRH_c20a]